MRLPQELFGCITDPIVKVCLAGHQNQLGQLGFAEVLSQIVCEISVEPMGLATHCIGKAKDSFGCVVEHLIPSVRIVERLDLGIADPSSSRRDDMSTQSSLTLVDDRSAKKNQLF